VVVLDAAHGGDDDGGRIGGQAGGQGSGQADSGPQGSSVAEKTVSLELSVRLRSQLTARGIQVVTTREGNVSLDADARAQIANRAVAGAQAAACLSLHASQAGSGVHIFVSSLPEEDLAVPLRFMAWKTAQSAYVSRSLRLASVVNSSLEQSSSTGVDAIHIPVTLMKTGLPGVDSMTCPAVAIEVAPIRRSDGSVATEATDQHYLLQIVEALGAAVIEWRSDILGLPDAEPAGLPEPTSPSGSSRPLSPSSSPSSPSPSGAGETHP
jgi:N-acetylmuramoyl-L-alanine amidase